MRSPLPSHPEVEKLKNIIEAHADAASADAVESELVQSIKQGAERCVVKITPKGEGSPL